MHVSITFIALFIFMLVRVELFQLHVYTYVCQSCLHAYHEVARLRLYSFVQLYGGGAGVGTTAQVR